MLAYRESLRAEVGSGLIGSGRYQRNWERQIYQHTFTPHVSYSYINKSDTFVLHS